MKIQHNEDYRKLRAAAYPKAGDQLDAIYKMAVALKNSGAPLPPETLDWIAAIELVKQTYPK